MPPDRPCSDVVKTQMVETETWKKFETKTRDQDLKKFSRPRSRLGNILVIYMYYEDIHIKFILNLLKFHYQTARGPI